MPDDLAHLPFLTVAEVARYLRVSETTVWRWCSSGKLPAFRIGRGWRVRQHDLSLLIERPERHADQIVLRDRQPADVVKPEPGAQRPHQER